MVQVGLEAAERFESLGRRIVWTAAAQLGHEESRVNGSRVRASDELEAQPVDSVGEKCAGSLVATT